MPKKNSAKIIIILAAMTIVLFVGYFLFIISNPLAKDYNLIANTPACKAAIKESRLAERFSEFKEIYSCQTIPWEGGDGTGELVVINYRTNHYICSEFGLGCYFETYDYLALYYHGVISELSRKLPEIVEWGNLADPGSGEVLVEEINFDDWWRSNFDKEIVDWCPSVLNFDFGRLKERGVKYGQILRGDHLYTVIDFDHFSTEPILRERIELKRDVYAYIPQPKVCEINGSLILDKIGPCQEDKGGFIKTCLTGSNSTSDITVKITPLPQIEVTPLKTSIDDCLKNDIFATACILDIALANQNEDLCSYMPLRTDLTLYSELSESECKAAVAKWKTEIPKVCSKFLENEKSKMPILEKPYRYCDITPY